MHFANVEWNGCDLGFLFFLPRGFVYMQVVKKTAGRHFECLEALGR